MILYIGKPKDSKRQLLEMTNWVNKFVRYNANIQSSVAFFYKPIMKLLRKAMNGTITFIIVINRKIHWNTFNGKVSDLCNENINHWWKKFGEDTEQ